VDRKTTQKVISDEFQAQAPIGNLGHILGVDESKIRTRRYPYLTSDSSRKQQLTQACFTGREKPVCGIAWRSSNRMLGRQRTIDLVDLSPLWLIPDLDFINLQYGDVQDEIALVKEQFGREIRVIPEVDVFSDIDGLLALIDMCDIVFTIDNVTAHLAGAVGKKSIVLVPLGSGRYWYWGGESPSLWYPSLNLVYQHQVGDWTKAIGEAAFLAKQIIHSH